MIPVFILCYTTVYSFLNSTDTVTTDLYYSEIGNAEYKVYYKDNDYYRDYLTSDMTYVADLIDLVDIDFNYQMNIEDDVDLEYSYDITATLVITNKDQDTEVLYKSEQTILDSQVIEVMDNNFVLYENVIIDYDEYNDYVNQYKQNYSLSVSSYVIISMNVTTNGEYNSIEESINENRNLDVTIPLSEQTIDITVETNDVDTASTITSDSKLGVTNLILFVIAFIALILTIVFLVLAIYVLKISKIDNDVYEKTIKKYLREYDKIIVNSRNLNIKKEDYKNVITINSIEELIDAYDSVRKPIIYYELVKNKKSLFVIIDEDTIYEYIVSKDYLMSQNKL